VSIIWNDGPRFREIYQRLADAKLTQYVPGKGYNVWMAYGYLLARDEAKVIVTHDSDILSYDRRMLARLCLPLVHPLMGYEYCKSYYGRVTTRMYGRVTRLFVSPVIRACMAVVGTHPLLEFLDSFRYPLSGEFGCDADLVKALRLPGDWGLEMGMLCDIYRTASQRRICQVDLGHNFEHKHQHLGDEDPDATSEKLQGLMKMAHNIAVQLFNNLNAEGVPLPKSTLRAIASAYRLQAKQSIKAYHDDAVMNGLTPHRHEDAASVDAFTTALQAAGKDFMADNDEKQIPSWNRVFSALDDIGEQIVEAVEADNRGE
jgi:glucosyl-3-phosphoglycerate synthase